MERKLIIIGAGAMLAAFGIGVFAGQAIDRGLPGARTADRADSYDASPQEHPFQDIRSEGAARAETEKAKSFTYDRLILETSGDKPRACLQFTRELDTSGKVNYADFVRLTPDAKPAITVAGSSLCLTGLAFNKEYVARIRRGAPAKSGERLEWPIEVTIAYGDKPAYVGFVGDGVVLPRLEADGLGLETVNVSKMNISVYRVSDRSIARKTIGRGESSPEEDYFYVWDEENGEDVGVKVFDKDLPIKKIENEAVTTVFPLGAALPNLAPGAYYIKLKDVSTGADKYRVAQAYRWVMFTDIAMTSYSSGEGIDVFARSIASGKPLNGVRLELVASNNDVLARATTSQDGRARFDKAAVNGDHPLTPRMIMAFGADQDFAALDLNRAPLDLSDRNVDGRSAPSVIDAYLYLDRGIYRPGETAYISGLVRDSAGKANDRPLTLSIYRPNSTEALKRRIEKLDVGGFSIDYEIPKTAPRGLWRIEARADGAGVVGSQTFSVEDFVPQRIEVKLVVDEESPMQISDQRPVTVDARYLYGAPAGALGVEAEARLRIDPNPFPAYEGYRFGPADGRFDERFLTFPPATTDATGKAAINLSVAEAPRGYGAPLRADLVVGVVEPGGRVVRESARVPVRPDDRYVGLKLTGNGYGFSQNSPAEVDAVLIDRNGKQNAGELEWRLVEEDYWFDWYRENGEWKWRRSYKDVLVAEGRVDAKPSSASRIAQSLDAGSYRLTATDPGSGASTDVRFYVGWRSYESGAETPDQATLTVTTEKVVPGGTAKLYLDPPYAGEAIIAIATDKVHAVQRLKVGDKGEEISIATDAAWGSGFYVLATIVTPRDAVKRPIPRRAMGVAHVAFDMSAQTLNVSVGAPELVRPRQKINAPIKIAGAARGEEVRLTIAAVDEGILRLTKFVSPDPAGYYFGKKRLGVDLRDDYGRILNANLGAAQRFGGDQIGGEGLTVVPVKSIALFEGPVKIGADGSAIVPLNVPDFNGELRLMAVAWSADKLGASSRPMTVRDPVPAVLSMPRFLAPGDKADATLLIDNVDGAAGDYAIALKGSGPLTTAIEDKKSLAPKQQSTGRYALSATGVGVGGVSLNVSGPNNFRVARDYPIEVRTAYFPVTEISTRQLLPGEQVSLNRSLIANFVPGSTRTSISFSRLKGVDPAPLLESLYRYPYGCSEQLVSSALPLLFFNDLSSEAGLGPDFAVRPRIQDAVNQLLNRQGPDGSFGLWREQDSSATPWLGAYIVDFLYRAKDEGYGVPDEALEKSYEALSQIARVDRWVYSGYRMQANEGPWSNDTTEQLRRRSAAYVYYVLARAGKADLSDVRYFHDALIDETSSPLAKAHIAAALSLMGDRSRSVSAFEKAIGALGHQNTGDYYQSALRDAAGVLALLAEVQNALGVNRASDKFIEFMKEPNAMHTQEKAFVLLASQALLRAGGPIALKRDGAAISQSAPAPRFTLAVDEVTKGATFENAGQGPIFASVSVFGSPAAAPAASSQGFDLTKRLFMRDGRPADLATVKQNDRLVVVLTATAKSDRVHPAIIADLLPAGFEIESVLTPNDGAVEESGGPYRWIGPISWTKVAEARDDRFVAAIDLYTKDPVRLAYLVRAVTPGDFVFPGAVIEDMYRPGVFARTESGRVKVAAAQ
ncbi:MAG: alpha-2-macroglobulin [Parvularculaceae bacterium]|nr:alpha-2-macroglobulin [Parvularculaceae bacterium]